MARGKRKAGKEICRTIFRRHGIKIERIVSTGQKSPEGFWYDSPRNEWVMVLQGAGRLKFEDRKRSRTLRAGDHVFIPAHQRHRVEWTKPKSETIWLAVWF